MKNPWCTYICSNSKRIVVGSMFCMATVTTACGERGGRVSGEGESAPRYALASGRAIADSTGKEWQILWKYVGGAPTSLLPFPTGVVVRDSGVYVLDQVRGQVVRFDVRTGKPSWLWPDSTPRGVLSSATAITAKADAGIVILESLPTRLTVMSKSGEVIKRMMVSPFARANSICSLSDGSFYIATGEDRGQLARIDSAGSTVERRELPFDSLANVRPIAKQFVLASDPAGGGCWIALTLGIGFAHVTSQGATSTFKFVEPMALPETRVHRDSSMGKITTTEQLSRLQIAVTGVAGTNTELAIAFAGRSKLQGRLIDLYDVGGAYKRSLVFPGMIKGIARFRDMYVLLADIDGAPTLVVARHP